MLVKGTVFLTVPLHSSYTEQKKEELFPFRERHACNLRGCYKIQHEHRVAQKNGGTILVVAILYSRKSNHTQKDSPLEHQTG